MKLEMQSKFDLTNKCAIITGAGGFLGPQHAEAILECNGLPILTDWHEDRVKTKAEKLERKYELKPGAILVYKMDVTNKSEINNVVDDIYAKGMEINILINNAAKDSKVGKNGLNLNNRFETMSEQFFHEGINASITGMFLVTQAIINKMKNHSGQTKGIILNIASNLSVVAPDQRLYMDPNKSPEDQNQKPITYSISKHAVVGFTKWLASTYGRNGIRVNSISPGGVWNENIPESFNKKLSDKIPLGRMAQQGEYKALVALLCSEASSYITGENILIDGGLTII